MAKGGIPKRSYSAPDYDLTDIPDVPDEGPKTTTIQENTHTDISSSDNVVEQTDRHTPVQVQPVAASKRKRRELKPEPAPSRYVQRPLYASEEMIQAVRKITFETGKPAQEIYREGLLLRLQMAGLFKGMKFEDL